ncbi:hypothetical protein B0T16DRAFT_390376 [Cercophora newfieldiana]|uniref:Uncharacterized protein n=1 Tax=Cercophora newfieldiana TaxID=92897 RepID=A0AA39Y5L0_9PEZI|nr:hypothetical protein B0T16DRAFT_390376 [Cercophora newfieldiana]
MRSVLRIHGAHHLLDHSGLDSDVHRWTGHQTLDVRSRPATSRPPGNSHDASRAHPYLTERDDAEDGTTVHFLDVTGTLAAGIAQGSKDDRGRNTTRSTSMLAVTTTLLPPSLKDSETATKSDYIASLFLWEKEVPREDWDGIRPFLTNFVTLTLDEMQDVERLQPYGVWTGWARRPPPPRNTDRAAQNHLHRRPRYKGPPNHRAALIA